MTIVKTLRERPYRLAAETQDQANLRRQAEREQAADLIERLEGTLDWIVRVASDPGANPDMALRRIVEEANKALSSATVRKRTW